MDIASIRFDDGAAYEQFMGGWSRLVGDLFLGWLSPPNSQQWLDVGCGNGAFTERIVDCWSPAEVQGIDPSEGQLSYARTRPAARAAQFHQADAAALPFRDGRFDIAVMALVIFFLPEPRRGVAEMTRVVRPGGTVATYAWDMLAGGFPWHAVLEELRALGMTPPRPPSEAASQVSALIALWWGAGLVDVRSTSLVVHRTFASFDEYWHTSRLSPTVGAMINGMPLDARERLRERLRERVVDGGATAPVVIEARANAVSGSRPG